MKHRAHRLQYINFYPQPATKNHMKFSELNPLWKIGFSVLYICGAATILTIANFVWAAFFKLFGLL